MNQLKVVSVDGQLVTDSRDVAEMVGKEHKNLLRDIGNYSEILTSSKLSPLNFFIPCSYEDLKGERRLCYLLTKRGCDMVANKMTGEKGVLFTAAYVTQFEEMEKKLHAPRVLNEKEQLMASMKLSLDTAEEVETIKSEVKEIKYMVVNQITLNHGEQRRIQRAVSSRVYNLTNSGEERSKLFRELYHEIKDRFGVASYKDIKRKDMLDAIRNIDAWIPKKVA